MRKLAGKTMQWLLDTEQKYLDGLPAVTDPNRRRLIELGLNAVQEEIKLRRQQKKDAPPVPGNTKPAQEREVPIGRAKPTSPPTPQKSATQSKDPEPEPEHVMFTDILTKTEAPTIEIMLADGRIKEMTEAQLKRKAIDYFRDVLRSNFTIDNYHHSTQFLNCVRFLIGLYKFGNDILPHMSLHPTFNQCGLIMQGRSIELYEHIKEIYEKYKDS